MADPAIDALAQDAIAGTPGGMDRFLAAIRPQVLRHCQRILPDRLDAEEACQDALVTVDRRLSSFEGRSSVETWLYRVTANAALDTYRRLKRRAETVDLDSLDLASSSRTSVIAGNRVDLLDALEQVDERVVVPVLLRDLLGLPYEEIAIALDVPAGTVKSRIHEGRRSLQRLLDR